ncbi:MAG: hypothetical protein WCD11_02310 [Solirubrobacteraceae bacterium]
MAHLAAAPASAELRDRSALAPFDAGGTHTLQSPTNHQLSQQVDRRAGSGQHAVAGITFTSWRA